MKALATNVIVHLLMNDDKAQARRAKDVLEKAEAETARYFLPLVVILEAIWVLGRSRVEPE